MANWNKRERLVCYETTNNTKRRKKDKVRSDDLDYHADINVVDIRNKSAERVCLLQKSGLRYPSNGRN